MSNLALLKSRRLGPLVLAQTCGALNDNLVKNAMVVLAIFNLGIGGVGLSALAGALFIAPYILLSATAGKLADRFDKPRRRARPRPPKSAHAPRRRRFLSPSVPGLFAVLFGLGVQATLFGPLKYGMLPEHLPEQELIAGNGLIEATTFLVHRHRHRRRRRAHPAAPPAPPGSAPSASPSPCSACSAPCASSTCPPPIPRCHLRVNILAETWRVVRHASRLRAIWLSCSACPGSGPSAPP